MGKKKNRWSLAPALGLFLLSLATGCGDDEKKHSIFDVDDFDCVGFPNWIEVTVASPDCETDGIFLLMEDSLVYSDDEVILPYKDQPGKRLNIGFCFGNRDRVPSCDPNSSVLNINVYNVQDAIEE